MDVASQMVTAFEAIHDRVTNISSNTHTHTHKTCSQYVPPQIAPVTVPDDEESS